MSINPDNTFLPPLAGRVRAYAREMGLWEAGMCLLVAVSGGPDSVALLDLLRMQAREERLRLVVAHVHHGLRAEAEEDVAFVEALAGRWGLPFLLHRVDVPARVAATGESVEEAARELRYAALREMAAESGAARIVTGHTADDQAETVLMRLLRGAGLAGLAGIPPRRAEIVRPLLTVWRTEILAYLHARGLDYRTDLTNASLDFTRNRVRAELLPMLEQAYAPRLRARLHHLAEITRADAEALDGWAEREYDRLAQSLPEGIALPAELSLPRAIVWRLWRRAIAEVRGGLADIGYAHLEDIHRLPPGSQVHLPGVQVLHEAGRLVFLPTPGGEAPAIGIPEETLPAPGRACFLDAACCVTAEIVDGAAGLAAGDIAVLDADAVHGPLTVRGWQPGDRYRPLGAPGTRKVQDIFVDSRVPRRLRARIPVILDSRGIVWLAGFRIADRVKMKSTTMRSLRLSIEWELNPWTL